LSLPHHQTGTLSRAHPPLPSQGLGDRTAAIDHAALFSERADECARRSLPARARAYDRGCGRRDGGAVRFRARPAVSAGQPQKVFPVSWDEFHRDARALAWRLAAAGPFDSIVAITRGGL